MGLVYAEIELIRSDDLALWRAGYLEENQIRRMGSIPKKLVQAARGRVGKKASFFNSSHRPAL